MSGPVMTLPFDRHRLSVRIWLQVAGPIEILRIL